MVFHYIVYLLTIGYRHDATQGYLPPELFRSTSLVPLGSNWVSEEAENFKELEFFGLVRCFSVKTKKSSKTSKIEPKTWKKCHFGAVFQNLCNFDWKTANQTKKFEFLAVFRFFWHPVWPQRRETSGAKWFRRQIPLCEGVCLNPRIQQLPNQFYSNAHLKAIWLDQVSMQ